MYGCDMVCMACAGALCVQVDAIEDKTRQQLQDVADGKELPKADAENLQKKRKLIKLE